MTICGVTKTPVLEMEQRACCSALNDTQSLGSPEVVADSLTCLLPCQLGYREQTFIILPCTWDPTFDLKESSSLFCQQHQREYGSTYIMLES